MATSALAWSHSDVLSSTFHLATKYSHLTFTPQCVHDFHNYQRLVSEVTLLLAERHIEQ